MRVVTRAELPPGAWDAFVGSHPHGWWFHTAAWLAYSLAYTPGAVDRSFAVVSSTGRVIGVVPLVVQEGQLVCGGQVTPAPLLAPAAASRAYEHASALLGRVLGPIALRPGLVPPPGERAPEGWQWSLKGTWVVHLDKPEPELWTGVRRSYHSLIHRAEERFNLLVFGPTNRYATDVARALHIKSAGRETRSLATWDLMGEWITTRNGVLAVAIRADGTNEPVGFAYVLRYKHWAYYASGATLELNLAHALQWQVLKALRCDGATRFYEVGHDAEEGESEKAKGIARFKAGFGGRRWPVTELEPVQH